uniref:Ribosomal protein S20 n=1 Tax=Pteridomonas danica TaxID=38822 RepID=A0A7T1FV03_9STRA|nr:ribosomal protein S20 [Pteridomonas danica]QPM99324.1 ribosomal protein S20 [Pteridomonas danica]
MKQYKFNLKKIKRQTQLNKIYISRIKTFSKKCFIYIKKYQIEFNKFFLFLITKNLNLAYCALDKSLKKKIFHKNTISRKKSKLQTLVNLIL